MLRDARDGETGRPADGVGDVAGLSAMTIDAERTHRLDVRAPGDAGHADPVAGGGADDARDVRAVKAGRGLRFGAIVRRGRVAPVAVAAAARTFALPTAAPLWLSAIRLVSPNPLQVGLIWLFFFNFVTSATMGLPMMIVVAPSGRLMIFA